MPKIILGQRPAAFAPVDVSFIDPVTGKRLTIPAVQFKYRTRKEYGTWLDELTTAAHRADAPVDEAAAAAADADSPLPVMGAAMEVSVQRNAAFLIGAVHAWGLEGVPLTPETLHQLCDEQPAAAAAISGAYRAAVVEGRLGN